MLTVLVVTVCLLDKIFFSSHSDLVLITLGHVQVTFSFFSSTSCTTSDKSLHFKGAMCELWPTFLYQNWKNYIFNSMWRYTSVDAESRTPLNCAAETSLEVDELLTSPPGKSIYVQLCTSSQLWVASCMANWANRLMVVAADHEQSLQQLEVIMVTCCPTTGDQFLHIAPLGTV